MPNVIEEVKEADYESFEKISVLFGKDKNHVYYAGKKIIGIDPKTLKVISLYEVPYNKSKEISKFKDKNGEYTIDDIREGKLKLEEENTF